MQQEAAMGRNKVEKVMREFKEGKLRSGGSGRKVKSRRQAIAIALSEQRRADAKKRGSRMKKRRRR
ncbi:MAG TPA: hypothetical protein ENI87_01795 [bacterium]|nr:hypothetical protein [bacterium]